MGAVETHRRGQVQRGRRWRNGRSRTGGWGRSCEAKRKNPDARGSTRPGGEPGGFFAAAAEAVTAARNKMEKRLHRSQSKSKRHGRGLQAGGLAKKRRSAGRAAKHGSGA
ncbi:hypothetical protein TRVL_04013 [Trypanosoma vivax]|nr:hypothetical protein TRVL_04013 [Trypanosoma vivax]